MKFLVEHQLIVIEPFHEDGSLKDDLELRNSDLTYLGNEFFKEVFPKWSATVLLKGLNKLLANRER
ncbi:hypothetical protein MKZ15_11810 [Paenibacillus sp. FSL R7-0216]|uniref:hypothetical protein n=1 Tax=Paenibacillus sp. FSL R7-0216 TaxID=2921677 RepID=UPI0030DADC7E